MRKYACTVETKKAGVAITAHFDAVTDRDGDSYIEINELIVNGKFSCGRPARLGRLLEELAQLEIAEATFKRDYR